MPRNNQGVYSPPPGTAAITDTDISSTAYNGFLADISAEMTNSLNAQGTAPMLANFNAGGFAINNLAPGVNPTDAATLLQAQSGIPSGTVIAFAAATPPTGFLECNGASMSTASFANLFAAIGFTFGGSGASFSIPDLRGVWVRGWDHGAGRDTTTPSRAFGSPESFANATHTHTVSDPGHNHGVSDPGHAHSAFSNPHTHTDAGHAHTVPDQGVALASGPDIPETFKIAGGATATSVSFAQISTVGNIGIGVNAAVTGVSLSAAVTGVTNVASGGPEVSVRNVALMYCIKT